ncbi:putative crossover junction endonuclease EME2 [Rhynchocyon petersi]
MIDLNGWFVPFSVPTVNRHHAPRTPRGAGNCRCATGKGFRARPETTVESLAMVSGYGRKQRQGRLVMDRVRCGRIAGSTRRGRGRGQRRASTWEISDSDGEGPAGVATAARSRDPAEERRAAAEALRPERAVKRMVVRVDPAILEDEGADILLEALGALGCEHRIEPQPHVRSISWTRVTPDPCPCGVPPEVWDFHKQELLLLLEPEEFLQGIRQLSQVTGPYCAVPWPCLESPTHPHLAVIGLDAHLCVQEVLLPPECPAVPHAKMAIDWLQVEEALVMLQLGAGLDVLLVASWQELSEHVCAFTKALAQHPYKWLQESQAFSFCKSESRAAAAGKGVRHNRGLRGTWWHQIRQFNRVSPAMADAVVTAFPSPRLLQQAYLACDSEQERLALLADLPVEEGHGGRPRRVGPDLSRRVCLFLTSCNPDLLLDLSS